MAFMRSIEKLFVVILCGSLSYSLAAAETTSPFEEETSEVRRIFGETPKVQAENSLERFNFCKDDNLNDSCGVLVTFKGKDGKRSPHFAYFFTHLKRQVGATEYLIQNEDGTYHAYVDDVLDGTVAIDHVYKHNEALEVNFYKTR